MRQELSARRQAAQLGLPVPPLVDVSPDGSWFSERYISGTPINRLSDPTTAGEATKNAATVLSGLLKHSAQEKPLADYVSRLRDQIKLQTGRNHLLSRQQKQNLLQGTEMLTNQFGGLRPMGCGRITTALTHGDFQPANILLNHEGTWLIDWEYSARRQMGYDALVLMLRSRFPQGLAARLSDFITNEPNQPDLLNLWSQLNWQDTDSRRIYAGLFLLEEVLLHLAENDNPMFCQAGTGLQTIIQELTEYRQMQSSNGKTPDF